METTAAARFTEAVDTLVAMARHAHTKDGFEALDTAMQAIAGAVHKLAFVEAAHAYGAVKHKAGDKVGATNARDYLTRTLNISERTAKARMKRGEVLLKELPEAQDQQWRAEATDLFLDGDVGIEHFDAINVALKKVPYPTGSAHDIHVEKLRLDAFKHARHRTVEDTRQWVNSQLDAQAEHMTAADKQAHARKLRHLRVGPQDRYGGVKISGYLTGRDAAVVLTRLRKQVRTLQSYDRKASENSEKKICRSTDHYYADAFVEVFAESLKEFDDARETKLGGTASLVISIPAGGPLPDRYETSAGIWIYPDDIGDLLGDKSHWVVAHEPLTGFPLALGRTDRGASVGQKIALFAHQAVCAHPGCNRPLDLCQVHHIRPWKKGGKTDLHNLTLLCPYHHGLNDDDGTSTTRGRIERNTSSMRPEHCFQGTRVPNDSTRQQRSAGHRLRGNK